MCPQHQVGPPERIALPLGHLVGGRRLALPSIASDVPIPRVISAHWLLRQDFTLAEVVEKSREFASWLHALADAGFELDALSQGLRGLQRAPPAPAPT